MMESAAAHPEPAIDQDDIPYPCKGCGEVCALILFVNGLEPRLSLSSSDSFFCLIDPRGG